MDDLPDDTPVALFVRRGGVVADADAAQAVARGELLVFSDVEGYVQARESYLLISSEG